MLTMMHFSSHVGAIGLVVVSWGVNVVVTEDKPEECKCVPRDDCRDWAIGPRFKSKCGHENLVCCYVIVDSPPLQCSMQKPLQVPGFVEGPHIGAFGEFPWMVKIFGEKGFLGTGALIDERRVLSVAHLFPDKRRQPLTVTLGEWIDGIQVKPFHTQTVQVQDFKIHPHFNDVILRNDLAILYLAEPVDLSGKNPQIGTVCLPSKPMEAHKHCVLSTFGREDFPVIRKLNTSTMTGYQCQDSFRKSVLGKGFLLDRESFLCALEDGKDACKGDGGASLVCRVEGVQQLAGLVSWGLKPNHCHIKSEFPGVYVNLFNYVQWIKDNK